ncbi:hypothetical protein CRM77_09170 [Micrococcus luteus]|nr:DUF1846 domain-containing protein [Micrococcus luteus]PEH51414.1 hypothetical protein CRM77_09170 [Micrococcus luteus]
MGEPLQLPSASYLLRGRPSGLVGPGPSQQRHDLLHLEGCDVHTTTILGSVDEGIFRSLGMLVTSEPKFQKKGLYRKR